MREGLPPNHGLDERIAQIAPLLPSAGGRALLTNVQFDALEAGVARGQSLVVAAPTSTGKTLVGLWTIASAILRGQKAVYLVSHRALARQKFEEIGRVLGGAILDDPNSRLVIATGDGVEDPLGRRVPNPLEADVLVATYEKFLSCLAVNGPPRDLTHVCLVCDEIQLIGDASRGSQVELLLTLLKRSGWSQLVALSAVLSQRDSEELAGWLGVQLVRNPTREKALRIECRTRNLIITARADPHGGVGDLLRAPENRPRETLEIVGEMLAEPIRKPVIVFCMRIDDTYQLAAQWTRQLPHGRLQIERPPGAEVSNDLLEALRRGIAYHNAELTEDERLLVEARLESGDVDVVFSTTTLAAGVNFPLGSAVFHSWKRWDSDRRIPVPIGRAEFQNMAGRVGRMGQVATDGLVVVSANDVRDTESVSSLMALDVHEELNSRIGPDDFGRILLHLFAGRLCDTRDAAYAIVSNTLSAARELHRNRAGLAGWRERVDREIDRLIEQECLVEGRTLTPTLFGVAVARTGLKAATVHFMSRELFARSEFLHSLLPSEDRPGDEEALAFILCHAALNSAEYSSEGGPQTRYLNWRIDQNGLAPNDIARRIGPHLFVQPWHAFPASANGALLLSTWAGGRARSEIEQQVRGIRLGTVQNMARDVAWILTGISEIINRITSPDLDEAALPQALHGDPARLKALRSLSRTVRRQASRVSMGLPADVLWMIGLEQHGNRQRLTRAEIVALRQAGLRTPLDLMRGDPEVDDRRRNALASVGTVDGGASGRVREAARSWKVRDRAHCRRIHERRTATIDGGELVRRLYTLRGNDLEAALELAFDTIGIRWTRTDDGRDPGRPDYLLQQDALPDLICEVKSRQGDTAFVGLGAASEVLAASELMGHGETFCLTICSPSVDPSVPAQIEACGRLCVVDISDFRGWSRPHNEGRTQS